MPETTKRRTTKKRSKAVETSQKKGRAQPMLLTPAWEHASQLVKRLIALMEQGLDAAPDAPEHWERIFGTKESAVGNLQKLVMVLANIAQHIHAGEEAQTAQPDDSALTKDDYAMLLRWLESEMAATETD